MLKRGGQSLLEVAWKGTLLLAGASAVNYCYGVHRRRCGILVWMLALGSLLVMPVFVGICRLGAAPALRVTAAPAKCSAAHGKDQRGRASESFRALRDAMPVAVFGIWLTGALVCIWRWKRGSAKVARMRREAVVRERS